MTLQCPHLHKILRVHLFASEKYLLKTSSSETWSVSPLSVVHHFMPAAQSYIGSLSVWKNNSLFSCFLFLIMNSLLSTWLAALTLSSSSSRWKSNRFSSKAIRARRSCISILWHRSKSRKKEHFFVIYIPRQNPLCCFTLDQGIQYLRFLVLVLSTFGIGIGIGIESIPGLVNGIDPIVNWYWKYACTSKMVLSYP